jgi:hypothetical protein
MLGLFVPAAASALLLSGPASAQASPAPAAAAKADQPFNIGFVLYTKGKAPGTLDGRWTYGNAYSGRGVATGGPASAGFAGRYHVRYFLETGEFPTNMISTSNATPAGRSTTLRGSRTAS